ncbi:MAG TPA: TadE family protein [Pedococcus sp.]|uniref:TadE family protein n=1 Tax=Pedococcus sp. TaxID=2860345 RepID=UPI002F950E8F
MRVRPHRERRRPECGSAVADFAMVSGLVAVLFIAVFQVGLALHIRNTLISCAAEGARFGARADAQPEDGAARARQLISASVSERFAGNVTATVVDAGGAQVVAVTVVAPLPVIGPLGPDGRLRVVGRAFLESQ